MDYFHHVINYILLKEMSLKELDYTYISSYLLLLVKQYYGNSIFILKLTVIFIYY
jgi:hypothetical protein